MKEKDRQLIVERIQKDIEERKKIISLENYDE